MILNKNNVFFQFFFLLAQSVKYFLSNMMHHGKEELTFFYLTIFYSLRRKKMKKIMIIISLSMCIVISNAWAQLSLSTGNRMLISQDENANMRQGQSRLSTGLRVNKSVNSEVRTLGNQRIALPDEVIHSPNEFKGQAIMPAIFAYHCNNHDPDVQNCGDHTVPYGNNLFTDVHFTHTWFQIMNTSAVTFSHDNSEIIIEVYGQNGDLIDVNGGPAWYSNGIIDLLDPSLCGIDGLKPNESIFFYFGTWMHDEDADKNPPYSAKLIANAKLEYGLTAKCLTLCMHVGWEEIIEDDDGQRYAKGGTLIDKETVELKPPLLIIEQANDEILELLQ